MLELRDYDCQSLSLPSFPLSDNVEYPEAESVVFRIPDTADSTTSTLRAHLSRITDILMEEFGGEPNRNSTPIPLSPLEEDLEISGWKSERVDDIESGSVRILELMKGA